MFDRAKLTAQLVQLGHAIAGKKRRRPVPRQQYPRAIERSYAAAIADYVGARVRSALAPVMRELPRLLETSARDHAHRADAGEGRRLRELFDETRRELSRSISVEDIERLALRFAQQTSTHQRIQLGRQVVAALGADVAGTDRRAPALIENFVANNVAKIRGISDKLVARTEQLVSDAVTSGMLASDLAARLETVGYGEREAAVVARDQIGKLSGQLNAARQVEIGVSRFIWRSVGDERVRDLHDEIDGEEFSYAEGGHPEEGLPGEPVCCRCYAEPVFEEIEAELDEG